MNARQYRNRIDVGKCSTCPNHAREGKTQCASCASKNNVRDRRLRYKFRTDNGLCNACGQTSRPGKTFCQECADKNNARQRGRRAEQGMLVTGRHEIDIETGESEWISAAERRMFAKIERCGLCGLMRPCDPCLPELALMRSRDRLER